MAPLWWECTCGQEWWGHEVMCGGTVFDEPCCKCCWEEYRKWAHRTGLGRA